MHFETPTYDLFTPPKTVRNWACVLYISGLSSFIFPLGNIIAPLILWLLKKEDHPYLNAQGKEVLNFQITLSLAGLVIGLLLLVITGIALFTQSLPLFLPLLPMTVLFAFIAATFGIINMIMMVVGAIKVSSGKTFRLPLTYSFIK